MTQITYSMAYKGGGMLTTALDRIFRTSIRYIDRPTYLTVSGANFSLHDHFIELSEAAGRSMCDTV